ncbi:MAG: nitrous oxide reductase family maturation protein NosD [Candidatus Hodarchaeota archaeon]
MLKTVLSHISSIRKKLYQIKLIISFIILAAVISAIGVNYFSFTQEAEQDFPSLLSKSLIENDDLSCTPFQFSEDTIQYRNHNPIMIDGDNDFMEQAEKENWPGKGTESAPYVIQELNITNQDRNKLIEIRNTNLHFQIYNCLLNGGQAYGILFSTVFNGHISNIMVKNSKLGISLIHSGNNSLSGNTIVNNSGRGISLYASINVEISKNTVTNNGEIGIQIHLSNTITLLNNKVSYNNQKGIYLWYAADCILTGNTISNNNMEGIDIFYSGNNIFTGNVIENNTDRGVLIQSSLNVFFGNKITNNLDFGILITRDNNTIQKNNFYWNNLGGESQVYDEAMNNNFAYNYWNDWIGPDTNSDGFVDYNYPISGRTDNHDPFPVTIPYHLLPGLIIKPAGGDSLSGIISIQWTPATDTQGHNITYSIFHSTDGGNLWTLEEDGLTKTVYYWDSSTLIDGLQYWIKIDMNCVEGDWEMDRINKPLIIDNYFHFQSFSVLSPTRGEVRSGDILIEWTSEEDVFNHSVTFDVSYSANNGTSWNILVTNLTEMTYVLNSLNLENGAQYLLRINASCSEGSWRLAFTNGTFAIYNIFPITNFSSTYIKISTSTKDFTNNSLNKKFGILTLALPALFITCFILLIIVRRYQTK